jgi:uncharacterized protein (TIGR03067 family)
MKARWLLFAAVPVLLAAGPAQDDRVAQEKQRLRGAWVWVKIGVDPSDPKNEDIKAGRVVTVFDGDEMITKHNDKETQRASYRLDPGKTPNEIDVTVTQGGQTFLLKGIYLLDGNDLKICLGKPGADRPKELVSKPNSETGFWVMKRQKLGG